MNLIEITNAYDTAEQAYADWSVLADPEVVKVVERAARHMADKYASSVTIEQEDARQEGLILVATHPRLRECFTNPDVGLGALHHRLVQLLTTQVRTEAKYRSRSSSYEVLTGSAA
ncbi:hypothetical protein SEA_BROPLEASE_45 [Streptomyces phage BroPlease]|nr:hypothetical protein SEA_BROPLEASE_45 [Streptomyces phage BroPlease]USH44964.1 hypothetical protein SEA_GREENWEASEL_46 [Streptomyces phage GreenWeasel]